MKRKHIELKIRQIETDLSNSLNKMHKPASEYTLKHMIRDKVLEVYKLGSQYACDFFGVKHFHTPEDFSDIGRMSDDVYRVMTYAKNQEAALIAMTSITLAKATRAKARQIDFIRKNMNVVENQILQEHIDTNINSNNSNNPTNIVAMTAAATRSSIMKQIELRLPSGIEDVTAQPLIDPIPIVLMKWVTEEDSLVCPDCQALEGKTWELDDPEIPTPVIDTHPNCRCRLELQTQEEEG